MEINEMVDALAQTIPPPIQLLPAVIDHTYDFATGLLPYQNETDDEPPVLVRPESDEILIDGYLGLYEPKARKITIFNQPIQHAASKLHCNATHLGYVVKLHEYAHALFHIGIAADERISISKDPEYAGLAQLKLDEFFQKTSEHLHENLAQLLTLHALNRLSRDATISKAKESITRMLETFNSLTKRQSPYYHIDDFSKVPLSRIAKGFDLLKRQSIVPSIEPWKTILTW